jgi:hypothetical protein
LSPASSRFPTFDEAVAGVEEALRAILDVFFDMLGVPKKLSIVVAGWSAERNQPEFYVINTNDDVPPVRHRNKLKPMASIF